MYFGLVGLSSPVTVVGRDPLGREGINKSTKIEALMAYGRSGRIGAGCEWGRDRLL